MRVDDHDIRLTHLDKVVYPETGTTKFDVISYYLAVADVLLPLTHGRPATRKRWPGGTGETPFFEKNLPDTAPDWLPSARIQHKDHSNRYLLVEDRATLVWLGQVNALEIHVPQWRIDEHGKPSAPDRFVLDLDPGPGADLQACAEVARSARKLLADLDLHLEPVTSGSKGIHLYTDLPEDRRPDDVGDFARQVALALRAELPDLVVTMQAKELREGKVLVDWSQNNAAKTTVTPYSLRGLLRPTVAAPRTWDELDAPDLRQLTLDEVVARVEAGSD